MKRVAALLAAALLASGAAGCGGSGAEPGAPDGATLVLDFVPNAVHSGIYAAQRQGFYGDAGVDLTVRQPGESTDAPKLLQAGRTDFAILDIHDLGIAREQGLDLVGLMPIVQRPLAAVIAAGEGPVRRPRDLEGHNVGVTGLPSDEAVVDSEVSADGGDPAEVDRVTIGFNAVSSLAAGRVDAATGFWNAEGVTLERQGVPVRIFKINRYGAPPYPELVLTTSRETLEREPDLVDTVVAATTRGYRLAADHPARALDDLLASVPSLDRAEQAAQLRALLPDLHPAPFDPVVLREWAAWDLQHGLLEKQLAVRGAFRLGGTG
ncbi:MAG TPA: ABC transporter substrate-binding protein [Solirubrobacterales bacterium]|jgi:ABC-type nitrate/sulfonate/bicarbonate transport system substrate-binding protein|nr:ABC transporter substrate-binding protein [Solirubrobacterales bacterium]